MRLAELLSGIEIKEGCYDPELEVTGVSYDSRETKPGEAFVAVPGFASDGYRFIPKALERGAGVIICEREPEQQAQYVQVADCRRALAQLSANWFSHPADKMTMIGVTGTNGKTTITYLLKNVLEKTLGAKVGLIGTIQNMIGDTVIHTERTTPESYELQKLFAQMVDAGCTHCVMEVSSHALALHRADEISFETGIFTNLTEDHLDFHKTMEAYCEAKAMLFTRCKFGVVNIDDAYAGKIMENATCSLLRYAEKAPEAELRALDIQLHAGSVAFTAKTAREQADIRLAIPGGFTVYNALAVIGAGLTLGIKLDQIAQALKTASGVKGRVEVVPTPGKPYTVLIDYSHTPDSLENVLKTVRGFCKGRVIAVFGCGGDRDPFKRPIMGRIGAELADLSVVTSDNPRTEDPMAIIDAIVSGMQQGPHPHVVIENRVKAIEWALDHAEKDDVIVLCGKGHETYQEIGHEKRHLDEREVVAAYLGGKA